jgi:CRP/FNR family cyclic AMP-dependent transcriptional regulator
MFTRSDDRVEALADVELFSPCTRRQLQAVAQLTDEVHLPARTVLMREGSVGHECFVLIEGTADVRIRGNCIAKLGPGEIVGEMALLEQEPRSATVVTRTPVRALVMTSVGFAAVLDAAPAVSRRVMRTLARRLRGVQSTAA